MNSILQRGIGFIALLLASAMTLAHAQTIPTKTYDTTASATASSVDTLSAQVADSLTTRHPAITTKPADRAKMIAKSAPLASTLTPATSATDEQTDATPTVTKFRRDIEAHSFVPTGQMLWGLCFNFSQTKQDNYQFLILENIGGNTYSMKVSPMFYYFIRDDRGIGGRITYKRSRTKMDSGSLVLDGKTSYDIKNFYTITQSWSVMAGFRQYINLGRQKRFGIYLECQIEGSFGDTKIAKGSGTDFTGTYKKSTAINLGFQPGLVFFLTNYSALELGVGVLGIGYQHHKLTTDRVYEANVKTTSANLSINLLSISFGVSFYL